MSDVLHTYRVSPRRRYGAGGLGAGVIVFLGLLAAIENGDAGIAVAALVFGLAFAAALIRLVDQARLQVRKNGLTLKQVGYSITGEWSNLARLDLTRGRERILFRRPVAKEGAFFHFAGRLGENSVTRALAPRLGEALARLAKAEALPLAPFMWQWNGALSEELRRRAPHLFSS